MWPLGFIHGTTALPSIHQRRLPSQVCAQRPVRLIVPRMGMSVKSEPLPKSQVRLEISVGAEECTTAWNTIIKELTTRSTIDGFRKGRAPKQVVIGKYGKDTILASACEEVIEKSVQKALKDSNINAIGQAEVDGDGGVDAIIKDFDPDSPLTFRVKVDVWPDAEFTESYENLEIEAEEAPMDEALVDKALEDLRKKESFSVLAPSDATVTYGHLVIADLNGYYRNEDNTKGEKLPEVADGTSVEVTIAEGQYMPGFVEGLIGAKAGETRDVAVDFPTRNSRPELAGAKAVFEVAINAIKDVVLPELTDEFAKQVSEEKTIADLRKAIRSRLGNEKRDEQEKNINNAFDTKLASIVQVDIPETLIENQVKTKFANMLASFKDNGMPEETVKAMVTKENYEQYKQRSLPNVIRNLKSNFAVGRIAKDKDIRVDKKEIDDQMDYVRAELKGQEDVEEDKIRDQIEGQLEHALVLEYLKKTAQITITPKKEAEV